MRILFYSNAPWVSTGYGNPTRLFVQHLTNLGYEIAVACNYGLWGACIDSVISDKPVRFYPGGHERSSNDVVQSHAEDFKADLIVSLYDVWTLKFKKLATPWIPWTMVDHQPVPPDVLAALKGWPESQEPNPAAKLAVAPSLFGLRELEKAEFPARCIPLGIDTEVFKPGDKAEARKKLGLPEDKFIVGFMGANKSFPSRKCMPQAIQAFAKFHAKHPNSMLYVHTEESGLAHGMDIRPLIKSLGLGPDALILCDQYEYLRGFPDEYMVDMYNAMDVLLHPSMAEGFGIPIIEAEACGTPVIAVDSTSMPELVSGGWIITDHEPYWSPQKAWQVMPHIHAMVEALEDAYYALQRPSIKAMKSTQAREKALEYDFGKVVAPMWDELLKGLEL